MFYAYSSLKPKVIVSANFGVEPGKIIPYKPLLDGALNMSSFKPNRCIIYNRPGVTHYVFYYLVISLDLDAQCLFSYSIYQGLHQKAKSV